ncbi:MAG: fused MFS/spermidine synthase [Byssovorax sp.]
MIVLYGTTIFLGAALLFLVEPLFARLLLPLLGGAPSVWSTAQVFFQLALLAGYGYVHLGVRTLGVRRHAFVHLGVMLLPLLTLPFHLGRAGAPPASASPIPWLLATMALTVGPAFLVVSATGPLLQRWFAATGHVRAADPYFLYAASNAGSLLSLLAYPTLIEPRMRLADEVSRWAMLYGALIVLMAGAAFFVKAAPPVAEVRPVAPAEARLTAPRWPRILRWIGLAFIPSSLMLATTTHLTSDIASAPLFWIAPLAIYLGTFILAFQGRPMLSHERLLRIAPAVLALGVVAAAMPLGRPVWLAFALGFTVLFVVAMVCHGELARDRPAPEHLTGFFFWVSLGGALGGIFCAIAAPLLFRSVVEYGLTLVGAAILLPRGDREQKGLKMRDLGVALGAAGACGAAILASRAALLSDLAASALGALSAAGIALLASSRSLRLALSFGALLAVGHQHQDRTEGVILRERSFFGALRVAETANGLRQLYHGATLHGVQAQAPDARGEPLSCFFRQSPIGQVFERGPIPDGANIAVVGLGVGTLSAYARPGERWTFFEIDPKIAEIAQDPRYFTFLAEAKAPPSIVLGDARRSLSLTTDRYDLLVLDAYSSDAVPVHLLTAEAFDLFLARLAPAGVLAIHVSNQHFDLARVVAAHAESRGLVCLEQRTLAPPEARAEGKMSTHWVILARGREDLGALAEDPRWSPVGPGERPLFTDDSASLLSVWIGR